MNALTAATAAGSAFIAVLQGEGFRLEKIGAAAAVGKMRQSLRLQFIIRHSQNDGSLSEAVVDIETERDGGIRRVRVDIRSVSDAGGLFSEAGSRRAGTVELRRHLIALAGNLDARSSAGVRVGILPMPDEARDLRRSRQSEQ